MGRAFSPFDILEQVSWAVGPGWYEIAPLALENGGGLKPLQFERVSPDISWLQLVTHEPCEALDKLVFGRLGSPRYVRNRCIFTLSMKQTAVAQVHRGPSIASTKATLKDAAACGDIGALQNG